MTQDNMIERPLMDDLRPKQRTPRQHPVHLLPEDIEALRFLIRICRRQLIGMSDHWRAQAEQHLQAARDLVRDSQSTPENNHAPSR